jgi:hypothetical protein
MNLWDVMSKFRAPAALQFLAQSNKRYSICVHDYGYSEYEISFV